ncbi:hypothetical protein OIU77_004555 [Salix suchowensis]|uniref:Secreted peptide n=1 Tax=Salix suchowensis TaxID=1278906 RepID=A0ABQ9AWS7_9ROSI|nr:hypothetical protein OIU77_004555 [Salix suchowensis]
MPIIWTMGLSIIVIHLGWRSAHRRGRGMTRNMPRKGSRQWGRSWMFRYMTSLATIVIIAATMLMKALHVSRRSLLPARTVVTSGSHLLWRITTITLRILSTMGCIWTPIIIIWHLLV